MKSCTHRSNRTPNQIDPLHHLAVGSTTPFAKNGVPNLYLKILNRISTRFVASLETMRVSGKDGKVVRESINICCRALGINNKVEAPNNPPPPLIKKIWVKKKNKTGKLEKTEENQGEEMGERRKL